MEYHTRMRFGLSDAMYWLKRILGIHSERDEYDRAMRCYLARKPFLISGIEHLTREEIHDRAFARADANSAHLNSKI